MLKKQKISLQQNAYAIVMAYAFTQELLGRIDLPGKNNKLDTLKFYRRCDDRNIINCFATDEKNMKIKSGVKKGDWNESLISIKSGGRGILTETALLILHILLNKWIDMAFLDSM